MSHDASLLGSATGVNLNSAGSDTAIPIAASRYIVRRVVVTNASTSLAISAATLGLFTGAGGTGTTVVTPAILTALTGATKFLDQTLALTADVLTAATLFIRNSVAHGGVATVDVFIFGDILS
jgi:hypothetical protein